MNDRECIDFLRWALPRMRMRWPGLRKVRRQVCRRISRRVAQLGLDDLDAYRSRLASEPAEWAALDSLCRVTISRFRRDRGVFDALAGTVLPTLARRALGLGRAELRVWSAGCASGEEPFTVKLVWEFGLRDRFPSLEPAIVATDADPRLLERAQQARYPASSLRELPQEWIVRAFDRAGEAFVLRSAFRTGVRFERADVRSEGPDGPFDLVLCRNLVFTYYAVALQRELLARIAARLQPGGALVLGQHESLPEDLVGLAPWPGARSVYRLEAPDGPG